MRATDSILTLTPVREYGPALSEVLDAVSRALRIGKLDLVSMHRARHLTEARQIFYWIARKHTARTYPEIGRFIRRDHATIIHGVQKIDAALDYFWPRIERVAAELGIDLYSKEAA
jgi:chromosomal replication initiation ATPase DnaA